MARKPPREAHFECGPGAKADLWLDGRIAEFDVANNDAAFADALHRHRVPQDTKVFVTPLGETKQRWNGRRWPSRR